MKMSFSAPQGSSGVPSMVRPKKRPGSTKLRMFIFVNERLSS